MTPTEHLAELRRVCEACTPGKRTVKHGSESDPTGEYWEWYCVKTKDGVLCTMEEIDGESEGDNAAQITALTRETSLALVGIAETAAKFIEFARKMEWMRIPQVIDLANALAALPISTEKP